MIRFDVDLVDYTETPTKRYNLGSVDATDRERLVGHVFDKALGNLTSRLQERVMTQRVPGTGLALRAPDGRSLVNMSEPATCLSDPEFRGRLEYQLITTEQMRRTRFVSTTPPAHTGEAVSADPAFQAMLAGMFGPHS